MSDTISKSALLETIDEMVEGLPKSRVDLGGYHTGQKNAFLGLIDTIQSGRFDIKCVQGKEEISKIWNSVMENGNFTGMDAVEKILESIGMSHLIPNKEDNE